MAKKEKTYDVLVTQQGQYQRKIHDEGTVLRDVPEHLFSKRWMRILDTKEVDAIEAVQTLSDATLHGNSSLTTTNQAANNPAKDSTIVVQSGDDETKKAEATAETKIVEPSDEDAARKAREKQEEEAEKIAERQQAQAEKDAAEAAEKLDPSKQGVDAEATTTRRRRSR